KYDYCCRIREVNFGENKKESMTCNSNNMIKPSDCDLSCDGEICGGVVCKADMVVDASGGEISKGAGGNYDYSICSTKNKCYKLSVKTPCTESDVIKQFPNKLDDNLKPIVSPNVCCGTTTTTTGQPAE
ncbi:MAG: hypothetical protein KJ559_02550, partial [Nanoarchaeota archaeon]|nr:hypothetical protein [Nanoarchaeota archaeon]